MNKSIKLILLFLILAFSLGSQIIMPKKGAILRTTCDDRVLDPGGLDTCPFFCNSFLTLKPDSVSKAVGLHFTSLKMNKSTLYTFVKIYNGPDTSGLLLGEYHNLPLADIISSHPTGALTIHFFCSIYQDSGFDCNAYCVSPIPPPTIDIFTLDFTTPDSFYITQIVHYSQIVHFTGNSPLNSDFNNTVYLSKDTLLSSDDRVLRSSKVDKNSMILGGNKGILLFGSNLFNESDTGVRYIICYLDKDSVLNEQNRANNIYFKKVKILLNDYEVFSPSILDSKLSKPSGRIKINYQSKLIYYDSIIFPSLDSRYYLSKDSIFDISDRFLESHTPWINSNKQNSIDRDVSIPSNVIPGEHFLIIVGDGGDNLPELNSKNNIAFLKILVKPTNSDFKLLNFTIENEKQIAGRNAGFSFSALYTDSVFVGKYQIEYIIYKSKDSILSPDDLVVKSNYFIFDTVDQIYTESNHAVFNAADSNNYIFLYINKANTNYVAEIDASNNFLSQKIGIWNTSGYQLMPTSGTKTLNGCDIKITDFSFKNNKMYMGDVLGYMKIIPWNNIDTMAVKLIEYDVSPNHRLRVLKEINGVQTHLKWIDSANTIVKFRGTILIEHYCINKYTSGFEAFVYCIPENDNVDPNSIHSMSLPNLSVYPNPVSDYLEIESKTELVSFQMTNTLGNTAKLNLVQKSDFVYTINLKDIERGIYVARIETIDHIIVNKRIVLE